MQLRFFSRDGISQHCLAQQKLAQSQNHVILYHWEHKDFDPGKHVALEATYHGETAYLSFANTEAPARGGFWQKRTGVTGGFMSDLKEELLLQGFKHGYTELLTTINKDYVEILKLKTKLHQPQEGFQRENKNEVGELQRRIKALTKTSADIKLDSTYDNDKLLILLDYPEDTKAVINKMKRLTEFEILKIAKEFPDKKQQWEELGFNKASKTILTQLNINLIFERINSIKIKHQEKTHSLKWAMTSGPHFHQDATYNCGSLILEILYEGGINHLVPKNADRALSVSGAIIGVGLAAFNSPALAGYFVYSLSGFFIGRGISEAYDGFKASLSYVDFMQKTGKNTYCNAIAIPASCTLLSTFVGSMTSLVSNKQVIPAIWTIPQHVIDLVELAARHEVSYLSFEHSKSESAPKSSFSFT